MANWEFCVWNMKIPVFSYSTANIVLLHYTNIFFFLHRVMSGLYMWAFFSQSAETRANSEYWSRYHLKSDKH
jgi:hypothetical protein